MKMEQIRNQLPDELKDIKLNVASVLTEEGAADLTQKQIDYIALTSAYTTKHTALIGAVAEDARRSLTASEMASAKSAASMMAMNNIYYRFIHLNSDKSFAALPAKLRMNLIANPGVDRVDFELACLAASAINGCGMCIDAHTKELLKRGASNIAIQSAVRIASVLNAVATGIDMVAMH